MSYKKIYYPELRFGGYTDIDGVIAFYSRVNALLRPESIVLDVGCGRGEYKDDSVPFRRNLRILKGKVAKVIGVDVDGAAQGNPFLDEFRPLNGDTWPIDTNSIDLVLLDYVIEHVADCDVLFDQICRVLKDGGYLCIRTTNRMSYVGIAATLIPNKFHAKVTSVVQDSRKAEDVFPTLYRCNTVRRLRKAMMKCGFSSVVYGYESEPAYLSFSRTAYYFGVLHQKFAPRFMRTTIFAFGTRQKNGLSVGSA